MGLLRVRDTGSKKKPRKLTKAELEAQEAFKKMQAKWDKVPKFATTRKPVKVEKIVEVEEVIHKDVSRPAFQPVVNAKKESPKYSGTSIVGIATLHKSNAVPVFSNEEAIEVSKMRRG